VLEIVRASHRLPCLGGAMIADGVLTAEGIAGVREVGYQNLARTSDRFVIGSCTMRMTAVMIGRLVDAGCLSFDLTISEALPNFEMREGYEEVTLGQLLSFTGGVPSYLRLSPQANPVLFSLNGTGPQRREQLVRHILANDEPTERRFAFSYGSYVLAGFIAATVAKSSLEDLFEREVFRPLGLASAGWQRPRTPERMTEPMMHFKVGDRYVAQPDEPRPELDIALGGAIGVHCSIGDLATFASSELPGSSLAARTLKPATMTQLQRYFFYRLMDGNTVFGSARPYCAGYIVYPTERVVIAVATNAGGSLAACQAAFEAIRGSVR